MTNIRFRKKLNSDDRGALEGLPLYLIILVVVAAIAIVIIISWLNSIDSPKSFGTISSDPNQLTLTDGDGDGFSSTESGTLTIIVRDSENDKVKGATVTLSGCDVRFAGGGTAFAETDENGEAVFTGLHLEVEEGTADSVSVTIQKSGYPNKGIEVPVIG